jgi:S1-C subfamily serine protease
MDRFGVQKPELKAIARTPSFTKAKDNSAAMMFSGITQWQGAKVKSLETIEEASSVGVSLDTGGVMVMELSPDSAAAKAGLRQGDLIIRLGNQAVKNVADLPRLAKSAETSGLPLEIFRDQRQQTLQFQLAH